MGHGIGSWIEDSHSSTDTEQGHGPSVTVEETMHYS